MQLQNDLKNYKLIVAYGMERETIMVTKEVAEEATRFKNRQGTHKGDAFFNLYDENGNYTASIDRNDLKRIEGPKHVHGGIRKGYYCEWGAYHYFDEESCGHWDKTGVDPKTMVRLRKEMYPDWADGLEGRPPKGYQGNAMTQTMQDAIVARAKSEAVFVSTPRGTTFLGQPLQGVVDRFLEAQDDAPVLNR